VINIVYFQIVGFRIDGISNNGTNYFMILVQNQDVNLKKFFCLIVLLEK